MLEKLKNLKEKRNVKIEGEKVHCERRFRQFRFCIFSEINLIEAFGKIKEFKNLKEYEESLFRSIFLNFSLTKCIAL